MQEKLEKSNLPSYIGLSRLVYIHLSLIGLTNCIHNLRPLRLQQLEGAIEEFWEVSKQLCL